VVRKEPAGRRDLTTGGRRAKTGFDRFFREQIANPEFAAAYRKARAEIDATDELVRALDGARALKGITKAELARMIEAKPEILRRLFMANRTKPTIETVLKIANVLGYDLELVPNTPSRAGRRSTPR
jgi:DNA-binding phage protein